MQVSFKPKILYNLPTPHQYSDWYKESPTLTISYIHHFIGQYHKIYIINLLINDIKCNLQNLLQQNPYYKS